MFDFALYAAGVFALIVVAGMPYHGRTWYSRWSSNDR
jgi:hypothetical protein